MKEPLKYYGTYTDDFGTTAIVIENDFENLYVEIDGVKFRGSEFSDLAIVDKLQYPQQQLERFTFWSIQIHNTDKIEECLCNCSFKFPIAVTLIDKINNTERGNALTIE
ncbi:MAG: DUF6304 family protein, partial [Lactococcus sp.]|nr:DUF6304 family protein [Lactococcus sp.]